MGSIASHLSVKHSWWAFKNLLITYLCMFDINLLRRCSRCSGVSLVCTLKSLMILKSERILSVKPVKQDILISRNFIECMLFLWRTEQMLQPIYFTNQGPAKVFSEGLQDSHIIGEMFIKRPRCEHFKHLQH